MESEISAGLRTVSKPCFHRSPALFENMSQRRKSFPFRFDPIPCVISRELLPSLSCAELKTYIVIMAHSWGFRKSSAPIPLDHIVNGQYSKTGKLVVCGTGLCRRQTIHAIHSLESRNLLTVIRKHNNINVYEPRMNREWAISEVQPTAPRKRPGVQPTAPPEVHSTAPSYRHTSKRTDRAVRKAPPITPTIQ